MKIAVINIKRVVIDESVIEEGVVVGEKAMTVHQVTAMVTNEDGTERDGESKVYNHNFIYKGGNAKQEALQSLTIELSNT